MDKRIESEETKIATIGKDIEYMRKDISEIKDSIKLLPGIYLTQKEHAEFVAAVNVRFSKLEGSTNLWKWLSPTMSALVSSGITFLFLSYLQHLK